MEDVYLSILKKYWGYDGFRGIQREIIESIGNGRDTLGLMPTGGGKSITFQVPALSRDGICIVVTPLIALMKDQVRNLRGRGIKAAAVYSGLSREEILVTLENCIFGNYKFLYVSVSCISHKSFPVIVRRTLFIVLCNFFYILPLFISQRKIFLNREVTLQTLRCKIRISF